MPDPDILVCIDPGTQTGVAYLRLGPSGSPARVLSAETVTPWEVADALRLGLPECPDLAAVVFEDTQIATIYARHRTGSIAEQRKKSRNVGRVDLLCDMVEHYAREAGLPLIASVPSGRKWDAERCRLLTGYDGSPNNQHVRDAIRAGWAVGPHHVREARKSALRAPTP